MKATLTNLLNDEVIQDIVKRTNIDVNINISSLTVKDLMDLSMIIPIGETNTRQSTLVSTVYNILLNKAREKNLPIF